jgi:hypothetical protein
MLEYLLEKKTIRSFLTKYSQNKWNYIVPLLVELAIIFLKKHFKGQLTSMQLKEIVEELKSGIKDMTSSGSTGGDEGREIEGDESDSEDHEEEVKKVVQRKKPETPKTQTVNRANTVRTNNHKRPHHPKPPSRPTSSNTMFRKPSSEWRKGDDYVSDRSISKMRDKSGGKSGKYVN